MSRLRLLVDTINGVSSEDEANKLVKKWLPHQASGIDTGGGGVAAGVRNCSLIAEFVLTFINMGVMDYTKLLLSKPVEVKSPYDGLAVGEGDSTDAMHLGALGHEMALVREGSTFGFFHAWEGKFHLFPKLNPNKESFNVFGDGVMSEVKKALAKHCKSGGIDVRNGASLRG